VKSGAGDRDRTGMASLEGWGSTIELHPQIDHWARVPLRGACLCVLRSVGKAIGYGWEL
jgi:hypothetical protein